MTLFVLKRSFERLYKGCLEIIRPLFGGVTNQKTRIVEVKASEAIPSSDRFPFVSVLCNGKRLFREGLRVKNFSPMVTIKQAFNAISSGSTNVAPTLRVCNTPNGVSIPLKVPELSAHYKRNSSPMESVVDYSMDVIRWAKRTGMLIKELETVGADRFIISCCFLC